MPDYEAQSSAVIVPLYGISSIEERIQFSDSEYATKYDPAFLDSPLLAPNSLLRLWLKLFPPSFLLWSKKPPLEYGILPRSPGIEELPGLTPEVANWMIAPFEPAISAADRLIAALRLFKQGKLRRGATWILVFETIGEEKIPEAIRANSTARIYEFSAELSFSDIRPADLSYVGGGAIAHQTASTNPFIFEAKELPFFCQFFDTLSKAFQKSSLHPKLELAIAYYGKACAEDSAADEILDLFICLESILTQKSEGLSHRLGQRAANILGNDGTERSRIFDEIKRFYDIRSRIVHGDRLKDPQLQKLDHVPRLQEYARRLILSIISVNEKLDDESNFYRLLDEMCLDENTRKEFQSKASKILHS